ncbi:MAG: YhcH/YjgK/YiaL family protein [Eubacteriales bacterium]|nr:YhcH/YjgK/YiaL family protein [Eubacteriales bacterium]
MIYGNVYTAETQAAFSPALLRAIEWCRSTDVSEMHESKFFPEGESFQVIICERITGDKTEKPAEVHRACVEVQYCAEGRQLMGYYPDTGVYEISEDHLDEPRDVRFYKNCSEAPEVMLPLYPGQYCIFFPEDVHRPWCTAGDGPEPIKMVVIKVPVDTL